MRGLPWIGLYILSGGRSSRFGSDKALAQVVGRPLILRVADQFPAVSQTVILAGDTGKYRQLGLPVIADPVPDLGPIGGLLAACEHAPAGGWILLSGCDTLFSDAAMADGLLARVKESPAKVIAYKSQHWEPMPALYHASILPEVRRQIATGDNALWKLIEKLPHQAVALPGGGSVLHINTPQDLLQIPPMYTDRPAHS